MKDEHTSAAALNEHSGHVPEEDRSGSRELVVPVHIELEADDLATVERLVALLEERRAEDARAVRRAKRIVGMAVLNAILSLAVLALLAMGSVREATRPRCAGACPRNAASVAAACAT